MPSNQSRMFKYLKASDKPLPSPEESLSRLRLAVDKLDRAIQGHNKLKIRYEIAGVALQLAYIAWHNKTNIEDAIDQKTERDKFSADIEKLKLIHGRRPRS